MRHIRSMYWNNIHPDIIAQQKRVLNALGHDLAQEEATGVAHGVWLTRTMESLGADDAILFLDIDCLPLNAAIVERAFARAEAGAIFGVAQTASHLPNRHFVYAGPTFLALTKKTWDALGRPSLAVDPGHDAAMLLSEAAVANGVPLEIVQPNYVAIPRWPLGDYGCLGIATVYGGEIFHLFESRQERGFRWAIDYVAECVIAKKPIDYVAMHERLNSFAMRAQRWGTKMRERFMRAARRGFLPRRRAA